MNSENAIEIRNMSKSFKIQKDKAKTLKEMLTRRSGEKSIHEVLRDVSLDIKKGETVVLIGTNGTGKSTLLKLMTKILYPNKGTVETQGKLTSLLELGAGFHQDFTGRENIYFNAAVFGMTRKEIDKRVEQIIEFSELGEFIDEPVRTYSSGMYMRLAFSIAINVDADILLVDEILAVGDQHFQNKCFEKLEELRDSNTTVVIVSHSLESVKNLCSRAIWIYKGHIQLDGDPSYVISQYLKQSAIDNRENQKKKKDSRGRLNGVLFIDTPGGFSEHNKNQDLDMVGWGVSDALDECVQIVLSDGTVLYPKRVPRQDVYGVYQEEYAGLIDPQTIGWTISIDHNLLPVGDQMIQVVLKDMKSDKVIDQKKVRVTITDETD